MKRQSESSRLNAAKKIKSVQEIARITARARREGKTVVTTNGCFDILHAGHVQNLEWSRAQGDILVVGVNSDRSVRANKGPGRPVNGERDRALVLAGLAAVDYVLIFGAKNPIPWLALVKPSIHIKGKGSEKKVKLFLPEQAVVEKYGGRVLLAPLIPGRSTTNVIEKILKTAKRA